MITILTIPSSIQRQSYVTKVMEQYGIKDYVFQIGKETNKRFDGLFDSIKSVIKSHYNDPYVIIFEDDIDPTECFSFEVLIQRIEEAAKLDADILLGGIKEFDFKIQKGTPFTKVHNYRGSQLMVIYKRVYDEILAKPSAYMEFEVFSSYNNKWNKYVTFPFLAYQENFPSRFLSKSEHKQDYINCENKIKQL